MRAFLPAPTAYTVSPTILNIFLLFALLYLALCKLWWFFKCFINKAGDPLIYLKGRVANISQHPEMEMRWPPGQRNWLRPHRWDYLLITVRFKVTIRCKDRKSTFFSPSFHPFEGVCSIGLKTRPPDSKLSNLAKAFFYYNPCCKTIRYHKHTWAKAKATHLSPLVSATSNGERLREDKSSLFLNMAHIMGVIQAKVVNDKKPALSTGWDLHRRNDI